MKIAVLSGKGGAGKTFLSVNLAASAPDAVYIDCDVEEPNGRIFLKPEQVVRREVCTQLPRIDPELCTGCRKCVDFCRFTALVFLKGTPRLFPEVCHSCGGCALVCPAGAIHETGRPVGVVEEGTHGSTRVITGVLNYGEASGIPVIHQAVAAGEGHNGLTVLDCPPGSACPVMETIAGADYCLLVAEPTAFGFHNFQMVCELAALLGKPCGVVINKQDRPYQPLEDFCRAKGLPILLRIPYRAELARTCSEGRLLCEEDPAWAETFRQLLQTIGGELQ